MNDLSEPPAVAGGFRSQDRSKRKQNTHPLPQVVPVSISIKAQTKHPPATAGGSGLKIDQSANKTPTRYRRWFRSQDRSKRKQNTHPLPQVVPVSRSIKAQTK